MPVSFKVPKEQSDLIAKIAWRADAEIFKPARIEQKVQDTMMDLSACVAQGCPLRLHDLLMAGDADFGHDITGIRRHLNRSTGQLENHFLPRFFDSEAAQEPAKKS